MSDPGSIEVLVGATTDQGRVRTNNEDGFLIRPPIYAVADGMGGMNAGEVASAVALEAMGAVADLPNGHVELTKWIARANHAVFERAHQDQAAQGMGTTLVAVVPDGDRLRLAHVGDSRAYMLREGLLFQLTEDHTKVNRMVKEGLLTPEEAERHPERNVITRALGIQDSVQSDEITVEVRKGDRLVLCTDGLSGMIAADAIRSILLAEPDPQEASLSLVQAANVAGGADNVTALVLDIAHVIPGTGPPVQPLEAAGGRRRTVAWTGGAVVAVALVAALLAFWRFGGGETPQTPTEARSTLPTESSTAPPPTVTVMSLEDTKKALHDAAESLTNMLPRNAYSENPFPAVSNALGQTNPDIVEIGNDLAGNIPTDAALDVVVRPRSDDTRYRSSIESPLHEAVEGLKEVFAGYRELAAEMKGESSGLPALRSRVTELAEDFADAYALFGEVPVWEQATKFVQLPPPPEPTLPAQSSTPPVPESSDNSTGNGSGGDGSGSSTG